MTDRTNGGAADARLGQGDGSAIPCVAPASDGGGNVAFPLNVAYIAHDGLCCDMGMKHMSNISKSILLSLSALAIAFSSPASAQFGGFGGMGMMGMGGFPGMGMGGFGGMGGMGMAGMAINALAAAAQQNQYGGYGYRRARYRASQQRRYIYPQDPFGDGNYGYPQAPYAQGYAAPQGQYNVSPLKTTHTRKGRRCYQQEWDAAEGYVNVAVPCR